MDYSGRFGAGPGSPGVGLRVAGSSACTVGESGASAARRGTCAYLDVKVLDVERIVLDELATWFDLVTHERGKHQVGFGIVFRANL